MKYDKLAILDVETTGAAAPYDRIIEIGVLRIEKDKIVRRFESLVNPEIAISPFIETLTGIKNSDLVNAPTFSQIKNEVIELLDDALFVAHNARFDYSFLRQEFKRIGISFSSKQLCTVKLSRLLFPGFSHHNLDSIMERFEIQCARRHRAFDDAQVIWDFLQKIQHSLPPEKIEKALKAILKNPSLPPHLKKEEVEKLPEKPGVYMFFGKSEIPLYIGKSVNIKDRVLSHFINDTDSSTEMEISQQVERIEHVETGGELGALILESELIKKMQPLYNRKLRHARKMVVLRKIISADGYYALKIVNGEEIESQELDNVLGIFKSMKSAKEHAARLVNEFSLCQKMLGLQQGSGPCFSYHLEKCRGACVKKENPALFNSRFILAFAKTKLRSWPFNGPILVKESSEDLEEALVFDKWCYLGKYSEYMYEEKKGITALSDFDVYKILQGFLGNDKNRKKVTTLKSEGQLGRLQQMI